MITFKYHIIILGSLDSFQSLFVPAVVCVSVGKDTRVAKKPCKETFNSFPLWGLFLL